MSLLLQEVPGGGSYGLPQPVTSVTGFAMTHCKECGKRAVGDAGPYGGYKGCVGEGLSCPPLCQPIPGHCRGRQSGHFLEIASLLPPPAALRRFPRPRATARVAPTERLQVVRQNGASGTPPPTIGYKKCGGAGRCGHRPLRKNPPLDKGRTDCHGRVAPSQ